MLLAAVAAVAEPEPKVPPGRDPGGVAVALIGTGVDYTRAEIADRLARDGEGEIVGWDLADNDRLPYESGNDPTGAASGTAVARVLLAEAPTARLAPFRVLSADGLAAARAVAQAARGPAKIAVLPSFDPRHGDWEPLRQAAQHFPSLLLVLAAGDDGQDLSGEPLPPYNLPNVLSVTAADADGRLRPTSNFGATAVDVAVDAEVSAIAAGRVAALAARLVLASPQLSGAALKQRLMAFARPMPGEQRTRAGFLADPARAPLDGFSTRSPGPGKDKGP